MRGTRRRPADGRTRRKRWELIGLLLSLTLILSQSIGVVGAAASDGPISEPDDVATATPAVDAPQAAPSPSEAPPAAEDPGPGLGAEPGATTSEQTPSSGGPPAGGDGAGTDQQSPEPSADATKTASRTGGGGGSVAPTLISSPSSGSLNVDLDQFANQPGKGWQNGDLNGNNSAYHEGDVVPFRLAIEGLSAGSHTIHLSYDFTAGGHEAYDFLATWDASESPSLCASGGGAVSSMCPGLPSAHTHVFPSDPFAPGSPTKAGLTVAGAESFSGLSRNLTMYGGTIDSIGGPAHSGPVSGNSTGDITVHFTSSGSAVLFAWGGHLAESAYWVRTNGDPNGASQVSGAPWHMRTQSLDGSGNKNQDRSIQPSAIVALPALAIQKSADAGTVQIGSQIGYSITVANTGNVGVSNVSVQDALPGGSGIDWSVARTTGDTNGLDCSIGGSPPSQALSCTKDSLAKGGSFTVHVTSPTRGSACGTYDNTASASADGVEVVQSQTATIVVEGCGTDLKITKTASSDAVPYGSSFSYTLTVRNQGSGQATGVVVIDDLADSLTGVSASYDVNPGSPGDTGACSVDTGNLVTCQVATLAPDDGAANGPDTIRIQIQATAPDTCGAITNTAHVSSDQDATGSDSNEVQIDVTGCVTPPAPIGIRIVKGGPALAHVGDTITYTFDVSLTPSTPLSNIAVSDPMCSTAPGLDSKAGGNQDDVLEPGETWRYSCTHVVTSSDPDPLPNTATVTGTSCSRSAWTTT
jgi:uncharacterized repeat protein (TIGR01451 family)